MVSSYILISAGEGNIFFERPQIGQLNRNIKHTVLNHVQLILSTKGRAELQQ